MNILFFRLGLGHGTVPPPLAYVPVWNLSYANKTLSLTSVAFKFKTIDFTASFIWKWPANNNTRRQTFGDRVVPLPAITILWGSTASVHAASTQQLEQAYATHYSAEQPKLSSVLDPHKLKVSFLRDILTAVIDRWNRWKWITMTGYG